jgi:hypothetical protein
MPANWLTFLPFKDKMKSFLKVFFLTTPFFSLFLLPVKSQEDACTDIDHVVMPFRLLRKGN